MGAIAQSQNQEEIFNKIKKQKNDMAIKDLCHGKAKMLTEFAREVLGLKFAEDPNYGKLEHLLKMELLAN